MTTTTYDLEQLHEAIATGETQAPPALTRQGRAYRRWARAQKTAQRQADSWSTRTAGAIDRKSVV